jgi:hypothetical protein
LGRAAKHGTGGKVVGWKLGIIAILLLLSASNGYSATILSESFEANPGYDVAGWTEAVGAGCSVDEDSAVVARPTGGGGQILQEVFADTGNAARARWTNGSTYNTTYGRVYFQVSAWTKDGQRLILIDDVSFNVIFSISLETTGAVTRLNCAYRDNGGNKTGIGTQTYNVDTWYIAEWWYVQPGDANDTLAVRISQADGTIIEYLVGTDATTPQALNDSAYAGFRSLHVGANVDGGYVGQLYFDLAKINDGDGWIGAEGGAPAAPTPKRTQIIISWLDRLKDWLTPSAWAWRTE